MATSGSKNVIPKEKRQCPSCDGRNIHILGWTDDKRARRYECLDCGRTTVNPNGKKEISEHKKEVPVHDRYVITCAQNATPVFEGFLKALKVYCKENGAELIIVPIRYRNPTSIWSSKDKGYDWWSKATDPDRYEGRFNLNDRLTILGDIKTQPTAVSPLTGFDTITGGNSGIIAHPKLELKTIATPHNKFPKVMTTTGAVTKQNYTDSKAGKKGDFHHTFGACVVEIDGDTFHLRQINAMRDGSFFDLNKRYSAQGVKKVARIEALIMGDTHVDFVDEEVVEATFGKGGIAPLLKPKQLIWHDLLDFYSKSHWHANDPFIGIAKRDAEKDRVIEEIKRAIDFVDSHTPKQTMNVLVPSNHVDALTRWVKSANWKEDPTNAVTYLRTALHMAENTTMTPNGSFTPDPFHYWYKEFSKKLKQTKLYDRDDSHMIKDIEVLMHGDMGPNGARGNITGLSKIGVKSVIGHSHSPGIRDGCYQTGTSTRLKLEYNQGPSSWLNTHCLIYPNGKRSLVSIINGQWRLE